MTPNSRGHINSEPSAPMQTGLTSRTTNFTPSMKDEVGTQAVSRQRGLRSGPERGSPSAPFRSDGAHGEPPRGTTIHGSPLTEAALPLEGTAGVGDSGCYAMLALLGSVRDPPSQCPGQW